MENVNDGTLKHTTLLTKSYIKRGKVSVRTYVRTSVTEGMASSVANDVTMRMTSMRTVAASAASAVGARRHNENDVTMTIAGLWRYDDWRHVATGCTALV